MRLCSHPQEPCPKLWKWVGGGREWPRENCKEGPGLSQHSHLQLESWCQGQPWRSPCNKPLRLPSSKDSFPKLPACPPAHPPWSCLSVPSSVCLFICPWVLLPAGSGRQASISPSVVAGVIPHPPKMGKGAATLGQLSSCTEEKCSLSGGTARSVGRWEPETLS